MGQYYKVVNLDKREYLDPHRLGDGLKLLEFGFPGGLTPTALVILLADGNNRGGGDLHSENPIIGSWAGDRIVVTGDYADHLKFCTQRDIAMWHAHMAVKDPKWYAEYGRRGPNVYHLCSEPELGWTDVTQQVIDAMAEDVYLYNEMAERKTWSAGGEKTVVPARKIGRTNMSPQTIFLDEHPELKVAPGLPGDPVPFVEEKKPRKVKGKV